MKIDFNPQFKQAWELLEKTSQNLFITGRAGTGKSTLLNLFRQKSQKKIAVLAPTGVAAVNISGETIHSFFRFRPDVTPAKAKKIAAKIKNSKRFLLYQKLETIVIDEISMVRADLMDAVDRFLQTVLGNRLPFGGKQMVFFGDLYQLPPVLKNSDRRIFAKIYQTPYFFSSQAFNLSGLKLEYIELEKIYRQSDERFISLLNAIRNRQIEDSQIEHINRRVGKTLPDAVFLTGLNAKADKINHEKISALPGKGRRYYGYIDGFFPEKHLPAEEKLFLKNGARVMLLNNDRSRRWINGTLGIVVRLEKDIITVRLDSGRRVGIKPFIWEIIQNRWDKKSRTIQSDVVGTFTQFPVKLAWALTIHKAQGKTFDRVTVDLSSGIFAPGQLYVALSRCRTLKGISLTCPVLRRHILLDYRIVSFLTDFQYRLADKKQPLASREAKIRQAIESKEKLEIIYLKASNIKSRRLIRPKRLAEMEYLGKPFYGLEAYCYLRKEERVFRLDRILEAKNQTNQN